MNHAKGGVTMDRFNRVPRWAPITGGTLALACSLACSLAWSLAWSSTASAEVNTIREVKARAEGPRTVVVVRGDVTPSFTVYRLEQPPPLASRDSPTELETHLSPSIATTRRRAPREKHPRSTLQRDGRGGRQGSLDR